LGIFHWRIARCVGEYAAVQEIAEWLEKLGMSEYSRRFAENGISVSALPHLTDQDLKDIGVLLGHRRIMLAAIGQLTARLRERLNLRPEWSRRPKTPPSAATSR
jgi:uncharacterized protein YjiS (DUF1127 family)